jgi:hypothetical protein
VQLDTSGGKSVRPDLCVRCAKEWDCHGSIYDKKKEIKIKQSHSVPFYARHNKNFIYF